MHVGSQRVARFVGVDDDHGSPLPAELERRGQAGCRSPDDGDVAGTWTWTVSMLIHRGNDRVLWQISRQTLQHSQEQAGHDVDDTNTIEEVVRTRLRSLRNTLGLSLNDLAARTRLSPSTISRIETGKRAISLDVLQPLAAALHVSVDALLDMSGDEDVVIRPSPSHAGGRTTWMLSRSTGSTLAVKIRLEPTPGRWSSRSIPATTGSSSSTGE